MKQNVTFGEIGNGELLELTNEEIRKMVADLRDPEKLAGSKRTITITITAAAPERRNAAKVSYGVTTKLGVREGGECQIFIGGTGEGVESALVPINQQKFDFTAVEREEN